MEELDNQNSEIKSEEKVPKNSKKKFIIIGAIVVLVLVIAGIVFGACMGKVNFSKKSKLFSAISKAKETFTAPLDAVMENATVKMADNLAGSDLQYKAEITSNIDSFEIQGTNSTINEETINTIKNVINNAKIGMDLKVDQKEKAMEGTVSLSIKDLIDEISANVTYNNNALAVSLPEFSDKYLAIFADSLEGTEYAELKKVFEAIENLDLEGSTSLLDSATLTKKEKDHFEKVYSGLFKKRIKPSMISTKSGEIKVDGKKKKCTKTIVKLSDSDVRDIISDYIEAFEKDDKGKEIILNKLSGIIGLVSEQLDEQTKSELSKENIEKTIDEGVEQLKSSLESTIKFDGNIVVTGYGTIFNTYGVDFEYTEDDNSAVVSLTFVKDGADIEVNVNDKELLTGKINDKKDKKSLELQIDQSGVKADAELGIELKSDKESVFFIKGKAEQNGTVLGSVDLSADVNVTNNTKDEYATKTKLKVNMNVPNYMNIGFSFDIVESIKKADITVKEINRTNAIDVLSENSKTDLEKYITEITPKAMQIMTKIQSSDLYKTIENLNSLKNNKTIDNGLDYNSTNTNTMYDYSNSIINGYNSTIQNPYDYNSTLTNESSYNSTINY